MTRKVNLPHDTNGTSCQVGSTELVSYLLNAMPLEPLPPPARQPDGLKNGAHREQSTRAWAREPERTERYTAI